MKEFKYILAPVSLA